MKGALHISKFLYGANEKTKEALCKTKRNGFIKIKWLIIVGVIFVSLLWGGFIYKSFGSLTNSKTRSEYTKAGHYEDRRYGFSFDLPVACYIHKNKLKKRVSQPQRIAVIGGLFGKSSGLSDFLREFSFAKGKRTKSVDIVASFIVYYDEHPSKTDALSYLKQVYEPLTERIGEVEILEEKATKNRYGESAFQIYRQVERYPDVWQIGNSREDLIFEMSAMKGFRKVILYKGKAYVIDAKVLAIGEGKPREEDREKWRKLRELKEKRQPKPPAKQAGHMEWMESEPFQNPSPEELKLLNELSPEFTALKNKVVNALESSNEVKWSRQLTESFKVLP